MEELRERVRSRYGAEARIVRAEAVTVGGIKGYLAKRHFEVTVRVPLPERGPAERKPAPVRSRAGIAALLAEAEQADQVPGKVPAAPPAVSTASGGFEELVQDLARSTGSVPDTGRSRGRRVSRAVGPGRHPGDLTVVVGLHHDALAVCLGMARDAGTDGAGPGAVYVGGFCPVKGYLALGNRAGAVAARAAGVEGRYPVFVAWGIESAPGGDSRFATLASLAADHVWVAVDARMKAADTEAWVAGVKGAADVTGMAVLQSAGTATPGTVNRLGLAIGWLDGGPSEAGML